jgi:pimeloyl-ACP methyl ester carboxylesterase
LAIVCGPISYEALSCHNALRGLADEIARQGMSCLRFDYPGEGDSLEDARAAGRVAAWIESIVAAIDFAHSELRVTNLALVGFNAGALLAAKAAEQRPGRVARLALLAPPLSGRALARQMKAEAQIIAADLHQPAECADGSLSIAGFITTADTLADLSRLSFTSDGLPRALLLMGPNEPTGIAPANADRLAFPGLGAMISERTLPAIPEDDWKALAAWLGHDLAPVDIGGPYSGVPLHLEGTGFTETFVRFGPEEELAGVLCEPAGEAKGCAVFLNTGANPHWGWGRSSVTLGRRLAVEQGIASLRMDLRGLGESVPLDGGPRAALYNLTRLADVLAAMDLLSGRGYKRLTLVGQCSGAYLALHAARHDERVTGLVVVNLLRFIWGEGETIEEALVNNDRSTDGYVAMLRSGEAFKRILRGDVRLERIPRALRKFATRGHRAVTEALAKWLQPPPKADTPEDWLHRLSARGVALRFLYSATDTGLDEFARYFGRADWRTTRIYTFHREVIEGADHNFTPDYARKRIFENIINSIQMTFET